MFYEIFEKLCHDNLTSPFAFCKEIGLSGGTAAYWKKSGRPPKRETLEKIAQKFGVSVDYLLGREEPKSNLRTVTIVDASGNIPAQNVKSKKVQKVQIGMDFGTISEKMANVKKAASPKVAYIKSVPVKAEWIKGTPPEPIALRATENEWEKILSTMTDESLVKLKDYAELLILQQRSQENEAKK